MRTETHTVTYYQYDELSDEAKEKVRDAMRDCNVDYDGWHEGVYDTVKTASALIGIDIEEMYFTGFSSQGDGACFNSSYSYMPDWRAKLRGEFGGALLGKFEPFGQWLEKIQRVANYEVTANTRHNGHYYHAYCMDVDVDETHELSDTTFDAVESEVTECMRNLAKLLYKMLEDEYDCQTSDDAVEDTIRSNEWEFSKEGKHIG